MGVEAIESSSSSLETSDNVITLYFIIEQSLLLQNRSVTTPLLDISEITALSRGHFTPKNIKICNVVLTFLSMDEILWCDRSNKTSSAVLLHATIFFFSIFYKMKFGIFLEF